MSKRKIEIYSAGCATCDEAIELVKSMACSSCEIEVLDMHDKSVAQKAKSLGVKSIPAVVVNGKLAGCCASRGPDKDKLRAAGIGQALN